MLAENLEPSLNPGLSVKEVIENSRKQRERAVKRRADSQIKQESLQETVDKCNDDRSERRRKQQEKDERSRFQLQQKNRELREENSRQKVELRFLATMWTNLIRANEEKNFLEHMSILDQMKEDKTVIYWGIKSAETLNFRLRLVKS